MVEINNKLNIHEGSINFWVPAGSVVFNNGETTPLVTLNPEEGSIFIVKERDNCLRVSFVVTGRGREDLDFDVSNLESDMKHMITFTWQLASRRITLYLDGKVAATKDISFE